MARACLRTCGQSIQTASINDQKKELYAKAVAIFEQRKEGKATANERDRMWNEAEQEAMSVSAPDTGQSRSGRAKRSSRVRVGDMWLDLGAA